MSPDTGASHLDITPYDLDEPLLEATRSDGHARVEVSQPKSTSVVLGRSSQPELELHTNHCVTDGVALHRRRGARYR